MITGTDTLIRVGKPNPIDAVCIGIDPGQSGAMAAILPDGRVRLLRLDCSELRAWEWLDLTARRGLTESDSGVRPWPVFALIEAVHAFPIQNKDGKNKKGKTADGEERDVPQGIASTFKFGQSYGFLRGMLTAALGEEGVRSERWGGDVCRWQAWSPQRWQKELWILSGVHDGVRPRLPNKTARKNRLKAHAQRLFHALHVTLHTADALLLAWVCREAVREGVFPQKQLHGAS